jgi:multiple sugar transport system substrate-binding protein
MRSHGVRALTGTGGAPSASARRATLAVGAVTTLALLMTACGSGSSSSNPSAGAPTTGSSGATATTSGATATTSGAAPTTAGGSTSPTTAASGGKTVDITFWTANDNQAEIKYLDSHFDASHPGVKVKGEYITSSDETTAKEVAAIKTGTEPNVVIGQDPSQLPFLAESGKVVPLNGKFDSLTNALYPGIKTALFYKGQQLGMALGGVGDFVLFYNKKDFAAAGIAGPPSTWTQLETDASKLSDPAKHHYGIYIPLGSSEWISYDWEAQLWADGGQLLNANDTKVAFDSPAGLQALTTWYDLVQKDNAAPTTSYEQAGSFDGANAFAGNDVAMVIDGPWAVADAQTAKLSFAVAPFPKGSKGGATNIGIGVASEFDHGTAQDNAATQFIEWLAEPAQGAYLTAQSGGLPSAPAQVGQPAVQKAIRTTFGYSVFAANLKYGHTRPSIPAYAAISLALSNAIDACLSGKVTPAQALATAAKQGNAAIASAGSSS